MLPIVTAPNNILSSITQPVNKTDNNLLKLIIEMEKTLLSAKDPQGVGLAAPQVGRSLRIFIAKPTEKSPIGIYINPEITKIYTDKNQRTSADNPPKSSPTKLEGCLSLPNIWGVVKRNASVTLTYLDQHGKKHTQAHKGFLATIIQHEIDHLNGILFPKRVLEQQGKLYKSRKNEKGEDVFDEIEI